MTQAWLRPLSDLQPLPENALATFLDRGIAPGDGGMHGWAASAFRGVPMRTPYRINSLSEGLFLIPSNRTSDLCVDRFASLYDQRPKALTDTFRGREARRWPTLESSIGKHAYRRVLGFREPSLQARIRAYYSRHPGAEKYDYFRRLADIAFYGGLFMKRGDLLGMKEGNKRELWNEIVVGFFMNTLTLHRVSTGYTILVDWFRCTNIPSNTNDIERLRTVRPREDEKGNLLPVQPPLARDQQYVVYERMRHDLMVHLSSTTIGQRTGPNALPGDPGLAFLFARSALFQVCHALAMGWRVRHFIHYDLHTRNILFSGRRSWMLDEARRPTAAIARADQLYVLDEEHAFRLPRLDTDGRIVKIIDFGRSRARVSSTPDHPNDTDTVAGTVPSGGFGIDPAKTPRLYDLRRLVFDLVANGMDHVHWRAILQTIGRADREAFYEFIARALDLEMIRTTVRTSWVSKIQRPLLDDNLLDKYQADQQRWFRLVNMLPSTSNDVLLVDAIFELSHGKQGARSRLDTKGEEHALPGRHFDHLMYNLIYFRAILRDDALVGTSRSWSRLAYKEWERMQRDPVLRGQLPVPVGWTAESALLKSALFGPYRLQGGLPVVKAIEQTGAAIRMNLTCNEAGVPILSDAKE